MQQVLDKYNLIYKAQADIRKSEETPIPAADPVTSSLISSMQSRPLTEEQDRTQWLYW